MEGKKKKKDIGNYILYIKCLFLKICSLVWWILIVFDIKVWGGYLLFCIMFGIDNR